MTDRPTAFVTGGAKRVGAGIVTELSGAGYDVFWTYRNSEAESDRLKKDIENAGLRAQILRVDLEAPQAAEHVAAWVHEHTKRLDVLVNNASLYLPDRAADFDALSLRHQTVNCVVPVALTRALSSLLRASRGHVINMLDIQAVRPMPSYCSYCSSKAAMQNATIALARELAPEVTVNGISPGVVDWPDDMPLEEREKYLLKVPLRRAGTPQDVAKLVRYLVTDGAYITGQIIALDGGRSIAP